MGEKRNTKTIDTAKFNLLSRPHKSEAVSGEAYAYAHTHN